MVSTASRHRRTIGHVARNAAIAAVIGVVVGILIDAGGGRIMGFDIAASALIGLFIYCLAEAGIAVAGTWIDGLGNGPRAVALGTLFFSAACFAWFLVILPAHVLMPGIFSLSFRKITTGLGITGFIGVMAGTVFYVWEVQSQRFRDSMLRVKETEFAERELALARSVQQRLQAPENTSGPGFVISARNLPAQVVAGDYYDVYRASGSAVGLAVADVAGKGAAAALITAGVKAMLPLVAENRNVAGALTELNRRLFKDLGPREFVALAAARFEPASGRLSLASAGLPAPYVLRPGRPPEALSAPGPHLPLGVRASITYEGVDLQLEVGDRLFLFTDGLPEAVTEDGTPFGYERFERLLASVDETEPSRWLDRVFDEVRAVTSAEPSDDWTALVLESRDQ